MHPSCCGVGVSVQGWSWRNTAHAQHPEAGLPVSEPFAQCLERPDVKGSECKQLRFGVDVPDELDHGERLD